ncbi:MAG: glycosyltransferase family A protein [Acetatifactor sp.]
MRVQTLVAAVKQDVRQLAGKMRLETDAVIVNQCEENSYLEYEHAGCQVKCYSFHEKGVGLNRNNALLRGDGDILLLSDEDIVYDKGYGEKIQKEFEAHPEADVLIFNLRVVPERATYHTDSYGRVRWYNCGRYPTFSFAVRGDRIKKANVTFSLLFGGGAPYSNGEDSLFLMDCLRKGLKIYKTPVEIGEEVPRTSGGSTWFHGYDEKFFYDRGFLYHFLYGRKAGLMALRFVYAKRSVMCGEIPAQKAYSIMKKGIADAKS